LRKAIIIGSGIAGMAVAALLSNTYNVEVYENNATYGGKLGEKEIDGYRFDLGPSLFTYPKLLEDLFEACGENLADFFSYQKLNENCSYFFEDGTQINAKSDALELAKEFEAKTKDKGKSIIERLNYCKYLFDTTEDVFLNKSLHKISTYLNRKTFKSALQLPFIGLHQSMHQKNKVDFKDEKTIQIFDRFATYNGSNPYKAPATLNVIPHLELNMGTFFPKKGMRSIADAIFQLCIKKGVDFHFRSKVEEITIEKSKAVGIRVNNIFKPSNLVVNNCDIFKTYTELLNKKYKPKSLSENNLSTSAVIFYWNVEKVFEQLGVHNILFSAEYKKEFDHLFMQKNLYPDPTVYVHISSKIKKDDAPDLCSNFFVMVNTPPTEDKKMIQQMIRTARKNCIKKLSALLKVDFENLIKHEFVRTPKSLADETGAFLGALYGANSNKINAAFNRHPNFHPKIKNMYFCGGTVHPGGGIPLALNSANIVYRIIRDEK